MTKKKQPARKNISQHLTKAKPSSYPSKKTLWAYWMQAIEPTSEAINQAFPGYHPQWVMQSQGTSISATQFRHLREHLLRITRPECAAYLRVQPKTVQRWEIGCLKVPFPVFELLRVVYESVNFRLAHPAWDGWFMSADGKLVSPDVGRLALAPSELNTLPLFYQMKNRLQKENKTLAAELAQATAENTKLRELFVSQGVVNEIEDIREQLDRLFSEVNTAHIFNIPQRKERIA